MTITSIVFISLICILFVVVLALAISLLRKKRRASDQVNELTEQVYVGNLPYHINENHLRDYFSRFGPIKSVRVIRNSRTGRSKGYAFVTYELSNAANLALDSHGKDMSGRTMVVRIAKPRRVEPS